MTILKGFRRPPPGTQPGRVPGPNRRQQAPHIVVSVFMRGLLRRLVTRIYFPDGPANSEDFVLNQVEPERRGTLVARTVGQKNAFEWDVVLQGGSETVFFRYRPLGQALSCVGGHGNRKWVMWRDGRFALRRE
jgi:hypothetical protein